MRVDVVEWRRAADEPKAAGADDAGTERALKSFFAAVESDDSLFSCEPPRIWIEDSRDASRAVLCSADFVLRFRDARLSGDRGLHFALIEKLVELLKTAGSAESLAARICLESHFALRLRLEAQGSSREQASLRWGLGVAHVQQALLFTSRYLRQQIGQGAN
jgi:hypothetical protein